MAVITKSAPSAVRNGSEPAKRLTLQDAIKGGRGLPSRVILHGVGGIGKTTFAAHAPKPFFLLSPGETGLQTLIDAGQLPDTPNLEIGDWENVFSIIDELRTGEHDHKTVVFDVLDGFVKLAGAHALRTQFNGDPGPKGWLNYSAGDRFVAATPWREFLAALDRLREERRMAIIGLAHTIKATYQNPNGPDYDRFVPDIYKDSWNLTFGWADIVLFGHYEVFVDKAQGDRKGKAVGNRRLMATVLDATADAKNRHGMTEPIEMGETGAEAWSNFMAAIKAGRESGKK